MDQIRRLVYRSIVVGSLHCFDLPLKFRGGAAGVDGGDLLIADEHWIAVDTLAEAHVVVLASAYAAMTGLRAHDTVEQVCVAISLRFGTLVTDTVASTALTRGSLA